MAELERFAAADRAALREWLTQNAQTSAGVWVVYVKGEDRSLNYDDIVEEALCFGWVDSLPKRLDEQHAMLRRVGCRYGQGFYFREPVPASELIAPVPVTG